MRQGASGKEVCLKRAGSVGADHLGLTGVLTPPRTRPSAVQSPLRVSSVRQDLSFGVTLTLCGLHRVLPWLNPIFPSVANLETPGISKKLKS